MTYIDSTSRPKPVTCNVVPILGTFSATILGLVFSVLRTRQLGSTQEEMAAAMRMSVSSWRRIETGLADISVTELIAASKILDFPPSLILNAASSCENFVSRRSIVVVMGSGSSNKLETILINRDIRSDEHYPIVYVSGNTLLGLIGENILSFLDSL